MKLKDLGLTLMHPFCNEGHERIPLQFEAWKTYPDWVWDAINVVLIDDCSTPTLESHYPKDNELNFNLKIYRIKDDLKYNLPGAWNLAFHVANTDWVWAVDSDKHYTKENLLKVLELDVEDDRRYQFKQQRHTNLDKLRHDKWDSGTWLIRKEHWAAIDGFDEELTGARSKSRGYWDPDFNRRLNAVVKKTGIRSINVEEYMPDYFGHSDRPHVGWYNKINRRRYAAKKRGTIDHPTEMLRFEWEQVYEQERT
jgi:hypothetical protein